MSHRQTLEKRAQDGNTCPAAVVALSPGHCYPQDVDVLKVITKLSYQSVHKKLQKGEQEIEVVHLYI